MVFSSFRFMVHGPSSAGVQWKPINQRSVHRDLNASDALAAAQLLKGKASSMLAAQNVRIDASCYSAVAYERNQEGSEVDLLIKVKIDTTKFAILQVHVSADGQDTLERATPCL